MTHARPEVAAPPATVEIGAEILTDEVNLIVFVLLLAVLQSRGSTQRLRTCGTKFASVNGYSTLVRFLKVPVR